MLTKKIAKSFPNLKLDLIQAGIHDEAHVFIKKALTMAFYASFALTFTLGLVLFKANPKLLPMLALFFPIIAFVVFQFVIYSPKTKAKKRVKEIDREVVFAGRFLMIELSAGIPLFDAISNVAKSYRGIGKYFQEIIDRVEVGKPIDQAITEVMELTPSDNFRKIVWQIMNSLRTGANVADALRGIIDEISRSQIIEVKNYGKKLNPLVMFYLMIAVIVPSLGVTMLSIMSSFVGLEINDKMLVFIVIGVFIMQLGFLVTVKGSRPGVDI